MDYDPRAELVQDSIFRTGFRFGRRGETLIIEMWVRPGGGVLPEHVQPHQDERLEVIEGELTVTIEGRDHTLAAGEAVTAQAGRRHSFHNSGDEVAHVRSEVDPALELEEFLTEVTLLANGGRRVGGTVKNPLVIFEGARLARRYRETVLFTSRLAPPVALQPLVFGPLAWIGRRIPRPLRPG